MKITVAFFGIPRCSAISVPSIEGHILAPLRLLGDVRAVKHLWKIEGIKSARSGEDSALSDDAYNYFEQIEGVIEPSEPFELSAEFQRWKQFGDTFDDNFGSLRNLMHQLQSLKRATALARQTDPDLVVFVRPDLLYHDDMSLSPCRFAARFPRTCIVPIWNWWAGFNDRLAICGKDAYEAYGTRLDRAIDFATSTARSIHSESLVKFALGKGHVMTLAMPLTASRVRADGSVRAENFNSLETCVLWRGRRDRVDRLRCRATRQISRLLFKDASWQQP
jgi:hypothetical protein